MMKLVHEFRQDAQYTFRQLRRSPFYALTVLLTVALAVGATAAMLGVLRATLLNPLPYPHPEQLVVIGDHNLSGFKDTGLLGVPRMHDLEDAQAVGKPVFQELGFAYLDDGRLGLDGHEPVRIAGVGASGNFFHTIGAAPLLGRTITPADDVLRGPQVVVLSYKLWQTVFAGDRHVLGRVVHLGSAGASATVIGVMGPEFNLPAGTDLWRPAMMPRANFGPYRGEGTRFVVGYGRLAPGVTLADAKALGATLGSMLARRFPQSDGAWGFQFTDLRTELFGDYREALELLSTAVLLVLLAAAVNLAGLELSRNAARTPEFAIRGALGVSRLRLARQLLTENLLLVGAGAVFGVLGGGLLLHGLATRLPAALLRVEMPHLDPAVLTIASVLALLISLLTGALPAVGATRAGVGLGSAGNGQVKRMRPFGRAFTGLQIALSFVLLTLSAAVLERLYALVNAPLGFQPDHVVTFTVDLPWGVDRVHLHQLYAQMEQQFAALPGTSAAGSATALPLSSFSLRSTFDIAGQPPTPQHDAVAGESRMLSPGYLSAMHIPLLAGRALGASDAAPDAPSVFVVNQTFAKRYFPGQAAVGQRLNSPMEHPAAGQPAMLSSEIVGVIGDVSGTNGRLGAPAEPELYAAENGGWPHMQFALRASLPAATLEPELRRIVAAADARASVGQLVPLTATLDRRLAQPRLNAGLLTAFAALSLLLVVIGVYGLIAFDVAQRTREFGVRLALGSTRSGVLGLLLAESTRTLLAGLLLGAAGSFAAFRIFTATVGLAAGTDRQPRIVALSLAATLLLSAAVVAATLIPGRRAANLDPNEALRTP